MIRQSKECDHGHLYDIWFQAVIATHDFLSEDDLKSICKMVKEDYIPNVTFQVFTDTDDTPLAFMGMTEANIDSLFVDPNHFGKAIGTQLLNKAKADFDVLTLDVNEQNPGAAAFYSKSGFIQTGRSETDDQGKPYPLLHLRWAKA